MELLLPNSAFLGNIDPVIRTAKMGGKKELIVYSHPSWISVHPVILCLIAVLGLKVIRDGGKIDFPDLTAKSKHYLTRMSLFNMLGVKFPGKWLIREHEAAGRFIPLTRLKNSKDLDIFITEMIPLLHMEPEKVTPIKYIISELVRNVFEHAGAEDGAIVCAQFYQKSNKIRIGVADSGVGIQSTINYSYPGKDEKESLYLALTPGITGKTARVGGTAANAGAGLFFIKSIAKINRDFFIIYTGKVLYKLRRASKETVTPRLYFDPRAESHVIHTTMPNLEGTMIGIDISLDKHQEFDKLLELIRRVYQKGKKDENRKKYKRARFV